MLVIHKTEIHIPKGEADSFDIVYKAEPPEDGTVVLFSVKKRTSDEEALIEKQMTVAEGEITVSLSSEDTSMEPGEYWWDLMEEDGYRPLPPSLFVIEKTVGNRNAVIING